MLNGIIKMIARFIYKWVVYFTVTFINIVSPPIPKKEQKNWTERKNFCFCCIKICEIRKKKLYML